MSTVKTKSHVTGYELDGVDKYDCDAVLVKSHWNRKEFVVIEINGTAITVSASDLRSAILRCSG